MTKDQLITKQQIEIEFWREAVQERNIALLTIHKRLICIGGPLNDNFHQYSAEQRKIFHLIHNDTESFDFELHEKQYFANLVKPLSTD